MKFKKAFTLTELLAILVIIGIVLVIAIPSFTNLEKKFKSEYYAKMDANVLAIGKNYYKDNAELRPTALLQSDSVDYGDLIKDNYVDSINKYNSSTKCTGKVVIMKTETDYIYKNCVNCGNGEYKNYSNPNYEENSLDNLCSFNSNDTIKIEYEDKNEIYLYVNNYSNAEIKNKLCITKNVIRYSGKTTNILYRLADSSDSATKCPMNISSINITKADTYSVLYSDNKKRNIIVFQHPAPKVETVSGLPAREINMEKVILSIDDTKTFGEAYNAVFNYYQYQDGTKWIRVKCDEETMDENYTCTVNNITKLDTSNTRFRVVGKDKTKSTSQLGKETSEYKVTVDVTLSPNGGNLTNTSKKVTYRAKYGTLPVPTREGYAFTGWYTTKAGNNEITKDSEVTQIKNHTLYAHWLENVKPTSEIITTNNLKSNTQTVTLKCNDEGKVKKFYWGKSPSSDNYETIATAKTEWSKTVTVDSSGTYYLLCMDVAGNVSDSISKTYYTYKVRNMYQNVSGSGYTSTNYKLVGNEDTYVALKDTTLTLSSIYTVPLHSNAKRFNGYSVGAASTTAAIPSTSSPALKTDNQTYTMWFDRNLVFFNYKVYDDETFVEGPYPPTNTLGAASNYIKEVKNGYIYAADTTRNEALSKNLYVCRYGTTSVDIIDNNIYGWFAVTKKGYTLVSGAEWKCLSGCTVKNKTYNQEVQQISDTDTYFCNTEEDDCIVEIAANWSVNTYNIVFNGNENTSGSTVNKNCTYDQKCKLSTNGFVKKGYTFAGWAKSKTGSVEFNDKSEVLNLTDVNGGTVTLYAKWVANKYTIEYYQGNNDSTEGATMITSSSHIYDTEKELTTYRGTAPDGWSFAGWSTSTSGTTARYTNGQKVKNLTDVSSGTVKLYAVFNRTINVYSGQNKTTDSSKTQFYNPYKTSQVTSITLEIPQNISNWQKLGYRTNTSGAAPTISVTDTTASVTPTYNTNPTYYAVYGRSYTAKFHSGINNGVTKTKDSSTAYYNTNSASLPTTVSITLDTESNATAITNWTKVGWRKDTTNTTKEYDYNSTATVAFGTEFYSVYSRSYTAKFFSGINKEQEKAITSQITYYNSNTSTLPTTATVILDTQTNAAAITNWTKAGWRDDTTTSDREYNYGASVSVAFGTNFYGVYSRSYTAYFYSGTNKETTRTKSVTAYYNTNTASVPTTVSITLDTESNATAVTNWTKLGWRDDTSTESNEYSYGGTASVAFGTNFYSVYSRKYTANFYSGTNKATTKTKDSSTAYYNTNTASVPTTVSITLDTESNATAVTNWTKVGWRGDTTTGSSEYSYGATINVSFGTNFYSVYSRKYTANFYSGTNKATTKTKDSSTAYYNTNTASVPTTVSITLDTESNATAVTNWAKAGWRDDTTTGSNEYNYGGTASVTFGTNFYSVYSRSYTANFYSGTNKATTRTKSATAYYNTNTASVPTTVSISLDTESNATAITNWTKAGWRDDTTTGSSEYSYGGTASVTFGTNFYSVYSRKYTANFYSGTNKATTKTKDSSTAYYNTNTASVPTTVSITLDTQSNATAITNWTKVGWRDDTTAATKEYDYNSSVTVSFGTDFYSVYSRTLTVSYAGNGNTGGSTSSTTKTVYLNSNSTTSSSRKITLASNGFSKTGYSFSAWDKGSAGTDYTPSLSYNATTYGKTANAQWTAHTYKIKYNSNGGTGSMTDTSCTYDVNCTLTSNAFSKTGYTFAGWATSATGSIAYTNGATVKNLSSTNNDTVNLYARWRISTAPVLYVETYYSTVENGKFKSYNGEWTNNTVYVNAFVKANNNTIIDVEKSLGALEEDGYIHFRDGYSSISNSRVCDETRLSRCSETGVTKRAWFSVANDGIYLARIKVKYNDGIENKYTNYVQSIQINIDKTPPYVIWRGNFVNQKGHSEIDEKKTSDTCNKLGKTLTVESSCSISIVYSGSWWYATSDFVVSDPVINYASSDIDTYYDSEDDAYYWYTRSYYKYSNNTECEADDKEGKCSSTLKQGSTGKSALLWEKVKDRAGNWSPWLKMTWSWN